MATVDDLEANGALIRLEGSVTNPNLNRRLYALPRVIDWIETALPKLEAGDFYDDAPDPTQQLDELIDYFVGASSSMSTLDPHGMLPKEMGAWCLRTMDLRVYGWFWRKGIFIMSAIDTKARCLKFNGLASGYRNQCVSDFEKLDLDEPKFVIGEIKDVL
jgi:hypothetical protein